MMEKIAQSGEGGVHAPFTISTITFEVVVFTPVERADTLSLFLLYPYIFFVPQSTIAIMLYLCPLYHTLQQLQST
jgi:hypothetical protein